MILDEIDVKERLESPLNLMNRLRNSLSTPANKSFHPSLPPSSDQIVKDLEEKIKFGSVKSKAAGIMADCLDELHNKLPELAPKQLSSVAEQMSKIISNVQVKTADDKTPGQIVIYAPTIVSEEHFNIVDIRDRESA